MQIRDTLEKSLDLFSASSKKPQYSIKTFRQVLKVDQRLPSLREAHSNRSKS